MSYILVPELLITEAHDAILGLMRDREGKGGVDWSLVNRVLVGLGTALRAKVPESMVPESLCRFPNVNPVYPDRTCPVCHEDMNMQGGCRCNGYTMAGGLPKAPIR